MSEEVFAAKAALSKVATMGKLNTLKIKLVEII